MGTKTTKRKKPAFPVNEDPGKDERLRKILDGYWDTEVEHYVNLASKLAQNGNNMDPYCVEKELDLALELAKTGADSYACRLHQFLTGFLLHVSEIPSESTRDISMEHFNHVQSMVFGTSAGEISEEELRRYWVTLVEPSIQAANNSVNMLDRFELRTAQIIRGQLEIARAILILYKHALRRYLGGENEL